ncbi:MAG: VCBS repeat-containing protein [Planctomycetota bacterium]
MHTGRYWDPKSRAHTSGTGPGHRAYSAVPADIDDDGDLDLLIGTDAGGVFVRKNVGSAKKPAFSTELGALPGVETSPTFAGGYAMPVVVDWDGDGLFDLVSGGKKGGVAWMRNAGEPGSPRFERQRWILEPRDTSDERIGDRTQIEVADFDADGDLDLLVGDYERTGSGKTAERRANVWLYRRKGPEAGQ